MSDIPAPAEVLELPVSEHFHTVQGEGPSTGTRAVFIRLGGCNLACKWCDTPYTWDGSRFDLRREIRATPVVELLDALDAAAAPLLVLTGGEPLLHQHSAGWQELVTGARVRGMRVEVETNGTRIPAETRPAGLAGPADISRYVASPKLAHAGMTPRQRIIPRALEQLAELAWHDRAAFKFVVRTDNARALADDAYAVGALIAAHEIPPWSVWVMAEGVGADAVLTGTRTLAPVAVERGWNLSTRLHALVWGEERGR